MKRWCYEWKAPVWWAMNRLRQKTTGADQGPFRVEHLVRRKVGTSAFYDLFYISGRACNACAGAYLRHDAERICQLANRRYARLFT